MSHLRTLEASQQAHIDELVQRSRTHEQTIKRLKEQLALEKTRAADRLSAIQQDWKDACEIVQTLHHLNELRLIDELEFERVNFLNEQDALRREKIIRQQKEFHLTILQAREFELQLRVEQFEDEKLAFQETLDQYRKRAKETIVTCLRESNWRKTRIQELEEELVNLRETSAQYQTSTETTTSKLKRTQLQLDGANSRIEELERRNNELERTNTDLQRQVDQWQELETKEGAEVEALRKARVELENSNRLLESQLEKKLDDLSKAKQNIKKVRETLEEWQTTNKQQQEELDDLKTQLEEAFSEIKSLKARLREEKKRPKKPMPQEQERELESQPEPSGPAKKLQSEIPEEEVAVKPKSRNQKKAQESRVGETNPSASHAKAPSVDNEIKKPQSRRSRKHLAEGANDEMPKKSRKETRHHEHDDNQSASVHMDEEAALPTAKPKRPRSTVNLRASSPQSTVVEDSIDEVVEQEQKKKKRKINIFAEPSSLGFMSQVNAGGSSLDIPTTLSPVKEDQVPARSVGGTMSRIISSFTRR